MHPNHIASLEKAKAAKELRQQKKDTIKDLQDNHNITFISRPSTKTTAGITVAYRPVLRDVIEFSTSVCHPNDKFDKLEGQCEAAANFMAGKTVQFRRDKLPSGNIQRTMRLVTDSLF